MSGTRGSKAGVRVVECATRNVVLRRDARRAQSGGKQPSRKPVRRGDTYCSPACGARCRHSEYLAARRRARDAVRQLGDAWQARTWENLGWFSEARSRTADMAVHIDVDHMTGAVQYWLLYNGPFGMHFSTRAMFDVRECVCVAVAHLRGVAERAATLASELDESLTGAVGA